MCLPIGLIKCYTTMGALLTLFVGFGLLGVSIFGFIHSDVWINSTSATKNAVMIGVLVADILIIITSILGIYGIKRGKPFLIFIFTMLVGFFCVVMVGMGAFASLGPKNLLPEDCYNNNETWVQNVTTLFQTSNALCNGLCPCNFTNLKTYSQPDQDAINAVYSSVNGNHLQLQSCLAYTSYIRVLDPALLDMLDSLGAMEEYLDCTGWCGPQFPGDHLIYKFSNVNDGMPTKGYCFQALKSWITLWSEIIAYSCFGVAGALALVFLCNMCICCHPERRGRRMRERFYDPAINTDVYRKY